MNANQYASPLPRKLMLSVSFTQGILLLILYRLVEAKLWPAEDPTALYALASGFIAIPAFFLLLLNENNLRKSLHCLVGFGLVIVGTGAFTGLQQHIPVDATLYFSSSIVPVFFLTMGIAAFKALMYSQEYSQGKSIHYASLFHYSWRNFLLLGLALLFSGLCIGLLMLWGGLFSLINVDIFSDIFQEDWFLFPASTTAFGFAIIIFRSLENIIDSVARLLKTLIKFLLPGLALLALLFILFLPFTGLQALWDTRFGSAMMLWLQALLLFSVNAVYQGDSENNAYPLWLHRLIYAGVATLPIYSIIAFHGIFTRIDQYGLTVSRCWAVLVALILACFAFGYLWGVIKDRDHWLKDLARVNILMGLFVMLAMVLVNSPIANLQKISASSQLARVESGGLALDELDLYYFRRLGRQGYLALQSIKNNEDWIAEYPDVLSTIENIYSSRELVPPPETNEELFSRLTVWPQGHAVPQQILDNILSNNYRGFAQYFVIFTDLNNDNVDEAITLFEDQGYYSQGQLWSEINPGNDDESSWVSMPYRIDNYITPPGLDNAIETEEFEVLTPQWNSLRIGEMIITPTPNVNSALSPFFRSQTNIINNGEAIALPTTQP